MAGAGYDGAPLRAVGIVGASAVNLRPVVITGANGFIGRALCLHLCAVGRHLRTIVRDPASGQPGRGERFALGDLAVAPEHRLDEALAGAAAVVHLAGRAHVLRESAADPHAAYERANVAATVRVAEAALRAGVEYFVLTSTVKVNGDATLPGRPFRPTDPAHPAEAYGRTKHEAERRLAALCEGTPMTALILRLPLVYGPGVRGNFATLLDAVAAERRWPLGAVRNRRSLLYVGNLVEAIDAALGAPRPIRGVHFVVDGESVSTPALVAAAGRALGVPARLVKVPVWSLRLAGHLTGRTTQVSRLIGSLEVDASSFQSATGWKPRYGLDDGLAATAAWWRTRHAI